MLNPNLLSHLAAQIGNTQPNQARQRQHQQPARNTPHHHLASHSSEDTLAAGLLIGLMMSQFSKFKHILGGNNTYQAPQPQYKKDDSPQPSKNYQPTHNHVAPDYTGHNNQGFSIGHRSHHDNNYVTNHTDNSVTNNDNSTTTNTTDNSVTNNDNSTTTNTTDNSVTNIDNSTHTTIINNITNVIEENGNQGPQYTEDADIVTIDTNGQVHDLLGGNDEVTLASGAANNIINGNSDDDRLILENPADHYGYSFSEDSQQVIISDTNGANPNIIQNFENFTIGGTDYTYDELKTEFGDQGPPPPPEPLFTDDQDTVTLTDSGTYDALDGNDNITLDGNDINVTGNTGSDVFTLTDTATNNTIDGGSMGEGNIANFFNGDDIINSSDDYSYTFNEADNEVIMTHNANNTTNTFKNIDEFNFEDGNFTYDQLLELNDPQPAGPFTDQDDTVTLTDSGTYQDLGGNDDITIAGNDITLDAADGEDTIHLGQGFTGNVIDGGADADTIHMNQDDISSLSVNNFDWSDTENTLNFTDADGNTTTISNVENFKLNDDFQVMGVDDFKTYTTLQNDFGGTNFNDQMNVTGIEDTVEAYDGDDSIHIDWQADGNTIDGGNGHDVAHYSISGNMDSYDFTFDEANQEVAITYSNNTNTFKNIETFKFANNNYSYDELLAEFGTPPPPTNPFEVNDLDPNIVVEISGSNETWADNNNQDDLVQFTAIANGNSIDAGEGDDVLLMDLPGFFDFDSDGTSQLFELIQGSHENSLEGFEKVRFAGGAEYTISQLLEIHSKTSFDNLENSNFFVGNRLMRAGTNDSDDLFTFSNASVDPGDTTYIDGNGLALDLSQWAPYQALDELNVEWNGDHATIYRPNDPTRNITAYNFTQIRLTDPDPSNFYLFHSWEDFKAATGG